MTNDVKNNGTAVIVVVIGQSKRKAVELHKVELPDCCGARRAGVELVPAVLRIDGSEALWTLRDIGDAVVAGGTSAHLFVVQARGV